MNPPSDRHQTQSSQMVSAGTEVDHPPRSVSQSTTNEGAREATSQPAPRPLQAIVWTAILLAGLLLAVILLRPSTKSDESSIPSANSSSSSSLTTNSPSPFSASPPKKTLSAVETSKPSSRASSKTETGCAGMTVQEFAQQIRHRRGSHDAQQFYARYGTPLRTFRPYTYFTYLWFQCRDGIAEVECESTSFEMYDAISVSRVRKMR